MASQQEGSGFDGALSWVFFPTLHSQLGFAPASLWASMDKQYREWLIEWLTLVHSRFHNWDNLNSPVGFISFGVKYKKHNKYKSHDNKDITK